MTESTNILTISQPRLLRRRYEISDDGEVVGALEYTGWFGQHAGAVMDGLEWHYHKHSGLTHTEIRVLPLGGDEAAATYRCAALRQSGVVRLGNSELKFKFSNWKSRYSWCDADDTELIVYELGGFFRRSGRITVRDGLLALPQHALLIPFGLYLGMDIESNNSAAAGAAAATSVAASF